MSLSQALNEQRDLLNQVVSCLNKLQEDLYLLRRDVSLIRACQVEQGKAIGEIEHKLNRQWSMPKPPPLPELPRIHLATSEE